MASDVDNPFRRYVPPRMSPDNGMRQFVYPDGSPIMRGDEVRTKGEEPGGYRVIGFDLESAPRPVLIRRSIEAPPARHGQEVGLMVAELMPCPFCGQDGHLEIVDAGGVEMYEVDAVRLDEDVPSQVLVLRRGRA